jgi:hypothetical protein
MFWLLSTTTTNLSYTSCPRSLGNSVYPKHPSLESRSDGMAASISLCSYFFMVFKACCVLRPKMHNYLIVLYCIARANCLTILWDKMRLLKTMMFLESFGCCKRCLKSWYIQREPEKMYFFLLYSPLFWQCNTLNDFTVGLNTHN